MDSADRSTQKDTSSSAVTSSPGHTPGPWIVCEDVIMAAGSHIVARVPSHPENRKNWQNDARLIAAAPDLLEALQECLTCEFAVTDKAAIAKAEAAIAKARAKARSLPAI